jgi:hypothetical protein
MREACRNAKPGTSPEPITADSPCLELAKKANQTILFAMKLVLAILSYAISAAILGYGILMMVHGKPAALIVGFLFYVVALAAYGCIPKKSH